MERKRTWQRKADPIKWIKALWARGWLIALAAALGALLGYESSTMSFEPQFTTNIKFYVNSAETAGETAFSGDELVNISAVILQSHTTLGAIQEKTDLPYATWELDDMIIVTPVKGTRIFQVAVSSTDKEEALLIANAVVEIFPAQFYEVMENCVVRVVDYPMRPWTKSTPNVTRNVIYGGLFGAVLLSVIVLILEKQRNVIREESYLWTNYPDVPLLGSIPDRAKESMDGYTFDEVYKLTRAGLLRVLGKDKKSHVMGISSSIRGEGKATVSINLAYALAETGKKILLIDGDMRRSFVSHWMEVRQSPGFSELLADTATLEQTIQPSERFDNWHVLSAGKIPSNPAELLGSARMEQLMEDLRGKYDYIIVDLPPVEAVSDAVVAAGVMDGIVMVVRKDFSTGRELSIGMWLFGFHGVKVLGFILNHSLGRFSRFGGGRGFKLERTMRHFDDPSSLES